MAAAATLLERLERELTEPVRDPIWRHIYLSPGLEDLTRHGEFLKLTRIRQLGPSAIVYPGATHTRASHSLGVCHLGIRILKTFLARGVVNEGNDSRGADAGKPGVSLEGIRAFLCACLFHDLGHFPFAHSLKELPLKEHEVLTADIVLGTSLAAAIREQGGADPAAVAAIVDRHRASASLSIDEEEILFYRRILSGFVDPDKLDYLNRDAYFCGVPYGFQDVDFILSQIVPHSRTGLALRTKGIGAAESLLFAKYMMYRTVYWHKTIRIATAMIKKSLYRGLLEGSLQKEELYGLDDESFFRRFGGRSGTGYELVAGVRDQRLLAVAYTAAFDPSNAAHAALTQLDKRDRAESALYRRYSRTRPSLKPWEIVIDIPESVGFEIDLPLVADGSAAEPHIDSGQESADLSFADSRTVFTRPVVAGFTQTLRLIRVMVPPSLAAELSATELSAAAVKEALNESVSGA